MSTPGLTEIWSLEMGCSTGEEASPPPKFDTWVPNEIILIRATANTLPALLNAIPLSETRLREESIIPLYSFWRNLIEILESNARERGVTVPDIPAALSDWSEEASVDHNALSAQFRPHLSEPMRVSVDWSLGMRDQDPRPHWSSEVAINSAGLDLWIQMVSGAGEEDVGSGWGPYLAQMTSDEIKRIATVMREEVLRIRAQPGSGWNEEEAKKLAKELVENTKGLMAAATQT